MCLVVKKCCFCVGLKPGVLALGYLNLGGTIFLASLVHLPMSLLWALVDDHYIVPVLFIVLVALLANFVLSFVLLYGIHDKKPKYVLSYLVAMPFMVGAACIIFISFIPAIAKGTSTTMTAISVTYILFQLYSLLIVRSHYLKMDKIESGPPILENA